MEESTGALESSHPVAKRNTGASYRLVVALALVAVLAAIVTVPNWWGNTVAPTLLDGAKKVESDFQANNSTADSAPKQQVAATWAVKDASVLSLAGQASQVQHAVYIERRLETLAILQLGLILAVLALVLRRGASV